MNKWPTELQLRSLCETWQSLLRLQNWKVTVNYGRIRDMIGDDMGIAWGRCSLNENHMRAKILVLHPDDYEDDEGRNDIEITLVHELLHILMDGISREAKNSTPAQNVAEEQAINVLSEILVDLYRGTTE